MLTMLSSRNLAVVLSACLALTGCTEGRTATASADASPAPSAGPEPSATIQALSLRLSTFHRNPTQAELDQILVDFSRFDAEMSENASLMAAFILLATERHQLVMAGAPTSSALQRALVADRAAFHRWFEDSSGSPQKNDVLWVGFFATGDERYLDRLFAIATEDRTAIGGETPMVIDLTGSSAAWSYRSNAKQWPEVLRHAERHAALGNAFAIQCVADAHQQRGKQPE